MANDILEAGITANNNRQRESGIVWTTDEIGYFFFITSGSQLKYRKTTNGTSFAAAVTLHGNSTGVFSLWADWWTDGTGTKIHLTYGDRGDSEGHYINLDTADDSVSGPVVVVSGISIAQAVTHKISISKARGGYLYIGGQWGTDNGVANRGFWRSIDNGANWTERADVTEVAVPYKDHLSLHPGNEADDQDMWCLYLDETALEISLKVYDDSGNSWSETAIVSLTSFDDTFKQMAGVVRLSDNHLFLVHPMRKYADGVSNDMRCWEINGAASITERGEVDTQSDFLGVTLMYDDQTGNLYAIYVRTHGDDIFCRIWYAISEDGGVTWGSPVQYSDVNGFEETKTVSQDQVIIAPGGRLAPIWVDNWNDDIKGNMSNSTSLTEPPPPAGGGAGLAPSLSLLFS